MLFLSAKNKSEAGKRPTKTRIALSIFEKRWLSEYREVIAKIPPKITRMIAPRTRSHFSLLPNRLALARISPKIAIKILPYTLSSVPKILEIPKTPAIIPPI